MLLGFMIGIGIATLMAALGSAGIYSSSWLFPLLGLLLGYFFGRIKTQLDLTNKRIQQLETKALKFEQQLNQLNEKSHEKTAESISEKLKTIDLVMPPVVEALPEAATLPLKNSDATQQTVATKPVELSTKPRPKPSQYAPIKPIEPNFIEKAFQAGWAWLFGGNTLVRAGIVILLIGIVFLLKLAVDNGVIPVEVRMLTAGLAGAGLLAFGWKTRIQKPQFAWALQGGGVAVMYLVIAFSANYYHVLPKNIAFVLLVLVAALSAIIAVKQNALPLAILGFTGGFLAPLLASTGSGNYVALFSIYLALNIAIAFIAFKQNWRSLNILGFAFTFVIGSIWGAKSYQPEFFSTTEPFLIAHFLLFTAIAIIYAYKQAVKINDYVDSTLVFGTPILGFGLQYALLEDSKFGLAYSALALGIFYIGLAYWLLTKKRDTLKFLGECFVALGIGFATLAIPLSLDGRWTSAAWAVEGVALLWAGLRQNQWLPRLAGLSLQVFGAIAFVYGYGLLGEVDNQNMFLGAGFIALSAWGCGWLLHKYQSNAGWLKGFATPLAFYAWVWWIASGVKGINAAVLSGDHYIWHLILAFTAVTSLALSQVAKPASWPKLNSVAFLLLPSLLIFVLGEMVGFLFGNRPPSTDIGLIAWISAFSVYGLMLYQRDSNKKIALLRAPIILFATLLLGMEWAHWLRKWVTESGVWQVIGWAIVPMLMIAAVLFWQKQTFAKTEATIRRAWAWWGLLPLLVFLLGWYISMSLGSDGAAPPLSYLPLLNPLDISLIGILFICLIWQRNMVALHISESLNTLMPAIVGALSFMLLNGVLLRSLHHFAGTPYEWQSIFTNNLVQVAFTLLWSITALGLMLFAHKRGKRLLWIIGAALMGVVVLKLFMLDLSARGTVERIVSFIGAGLLLLVMGYFAPLPPANKAPNGKPLEKTA